MSAPMETTDNKTPQQRAQHQEANRLRKIQEKAEKQERHLESIRVARETRAAREQLKKQNKAAKAAAATSATPVVAAPTEANGDSMDLSPEEKQLQMELRKKAHEEREAQQRENKRQKLEAKQARFKVAEEGRQAASALKAELKAAKQIKNDALRAEQDRIKHDREVREITVKVDMDAVKQSIVAALKLGDSVESVSQTGQSVWKIRFKNEAQADKVCAKSKPLNFKVEAHVAAAPVTKHCVYFMCPYEVSINTKEEKEQVLAQATSAFSSMGNIKVSFRGNVVVVAFDSEQAAQNCLSQTNSFSLQGKDIELKSGIPSDNFLKGARKRPRAESTN